MSSWSSTPPPCDGAGRSRSSPSEGGGERLAILRHRLLRVRFRHARNRTRTLGHLHGAWRRRRLRMILRPRRSPCGRGRPTPAAATATCAAYPSDLRPARYARGRATGSAPAPAVRRSSACAGAPAGRSGCGGMKVLGSAGSGAGSCDDRFHEQGRLRRDRPDGEIVSAPARRARRRQPRPQPVPRSRLASLVAVAAVTPPEQAARRALRCVRAIRGGASARMRCVTSATRVSCGVAERGATA